MLLATCASLAAGCTSDSSGDAAVTTASTERAETSSSLTTQPPSSPTFTPSVNTRMFASPGEDANVSVLLPFAPLPMADWVDVTGSRTGSGSAWFATWPWASIPSAPKTGPDWQLTFTGTADGPTVDPSTLTPLYEAAGFELLYANSDCTFGEGDATSTVIAVVAGGVVVSTIEVFETVADCHLGMSPAELLGILEQARICELDAAGEIVSCSEPLSPAADDRAAVLSALSTPGV